MMQCCRGWYGLCLMAAAPVVVMNIQLWWAVKHVVGDDRGWDPLSNMKRWSSRKIFRVGDNLLRGTLQISPRLRQTKMMHRCRGWYCLCLMAAASVALMNIQLCWAVQHVVGDDRGWDPLSNIKKWSSGKIFRVGDNLWFAYASAQQSVLELNSKEEYERCDMSNPMKVYTAGLDAVPLVEVGTRYFTSGRPEDCQRGMKLHVNIISDGIDHNSGNYDVVSDGLEKEFTNDFTSSDSSLSAVKADHSSSSSAASDDEKMAKVQAAEGPTSGDLESSHSLRSFFLSLVAPFCCLVTIMLYAMA